jgi:hypothetical protein
VREEAGKVGDLPGLELAAHRWSSATVQGAAISRTGVLGMRTASPGFWFSSCSMMQPVVWVGACAWPQCEGLVTQGSSACPLVLNQVGEV